MSTTMNVNEILWTPKRRKRKRDSEAAKLARLEQAESEVKELISRGETVTKVLRDRQRRNHWQDSIEQMIRGGA